MDKSINQNNLSNLFPTWLFPAYNLIGFLPLKPNNSGVQYVSWSVMISVLLTIFLTGLLGYITYTRPPFQDVHTLKNIVRFINMLNVTVGSMTIGVFNIVLSKKGKFSPILALVGSVETVFVSKGLGTKGGMDMSDKVTIFFFGALLFFLSPMSVIVNHGNEKIVKSLLYVSHLYIISMEVFFIKLAELVSRSFIRLNRLILLGYIKSKEDKRMEPSLFSSEPPKVTIDEIRQVHYKLCKAIEEINSFFGLQMVCVFAYIFVLAVVNPYYIVDGLIKPKTRIFDTIYIIKQMSWSLFAVSQLVVITWIATYTTYHAKRTGFHMSCLLSLELPPVTRDKVKLALMQISSNTCEFNVLDLFKINTTNITSFAGMAVTYFIVILQFESSNKR